MLQDHLKAQVLNTTAIQCSVDVDDVSVAAECHRQSALTPALSDLITFSRESNGTADTEA
jgi:hypothetical protein